MTTVRYFAPGMVPNRTVFAMSARFGAKPPSLLGYNQTVKHHPSLDLLPKDWQLRKSARLRERAESVALLLAIAAFWVIVFALNFFVGQSSQPLIR